MTRTALSACRFIPGDLILDAGCGFGATVGLINRSSGIRAVGLDMDVSRLAQARDADGEKTKGRAVAGVLPMMPFRPGCFQGIFCECVLSLIPEKARCLEEFYTALAPGGILVLADLVLPEGGLTLGACTDSGCRNNRPASCLDGALTPAALRAEVKGARFKIIKVEDHTRLLRQMACEMVFEHGSLDRFWQTLTGTQFPTGLARACRAGTLKPGYTLVMAIKEE